MCDGHDVQCTSVLMDFTLFSKSYLDEEKWRFGARYASSSALDYGGRVLEPRKLDSCTFFFKNLASLQSIQNRAGLSLIFWEHFSCVYAGACTGASCAPHVRAWQYLTTRTLGKPKVSRSEATTNAGKSGHSASERSELAEWPLLPLGRT